MTDLRKQALKNISDKDKHEIYQLMRDKKKEMSPEAYSSYRENMIKLMGDDDSSSEIDEIEESASKMRKRLVERRKGSLIKE